MTLVGVWPDKQFKAPPDSEDPADWVVVIAELLASRL